MVVDFSINYGGNTVDKLSDGNVQIPFKQAFNDKKIFVPRNRRILDTSHIARCLMSFASMCLLKAEYFVDQTENSVFQVSSTVGGYKIDSYNGASQHITIPSKIGKKLITKIGNGAFLSSNIKTVIISEGIIELEERSFADCNLLTSIALPNSLTFIGYESFRNCSSLTKIIIPPNVEKLGEYCFYKCESLYSVTFESGVEQRIGYACFSQCKNLQNIIFSNNLIEIEDYVFGNCSFKNIHLPRSLKMIGYRTFLFCRNLSTVELYNFANINREIFKYCPSLTVIIFFGDYLSNIPKLWQQYNRFIRFLLTPPKLISYKNNILNWEVVHNASYYKIIAGRKEYIVYNNSFSIRCKHVKIIAIGEEKFISSEVSYSFINTKNYNLIYNDVKSTALFDKDVDDYAMYNNDAVEKVKLEKNACIIGHYAFYGCSKLIEINIDIASTINDGAFSRCTSLTSVHLNNCVLGNETFSHCISLEKLRIIGVKHIPDDTFYRCIKLNRVDLDENIMIIGKRAFRGCMNLKKFKLPYNLKTLEDGAVSYMELRNIRIPAKLSFIGPNNFDNCGSMQYIKVAKRNPYFYDIDGVLFSKNILIKYPSSHVNKNYKVPGGICEIGKSAFIQSVELQSLELPEGLLEIKERAFSVCSSLSKVIIPKSVKYIGLKSFENCVSLNNICCPPCKIGRFAFGKLKKNLRIVISHGSKMKLKEETNWKYYYSILEEEK